MRKVAGMAAVAVAGFTVGLGAWSLLAGDAPGEPAEAVSAPAPTPTVELPAADVPPTAAPDPEPPSPEPQPTAVPWVDPTSVGRPYGDAVEGLLTFRGNPTRTFYGQGPVPTDPTIVWTYPGSAMCAESVDRGETRLWCGTGWTGQPAVFERDGRTWVVFGAYDRNVHFLDADTGEQLLPPHPTGDIIKGSVTIDPHGYPLVYTGSRDTFYRVLAIDGDEPRELWALSAYDVSPALWNNDWDGAGLILDDHLFVGGENSQLHIVRLNRAYDADGRVIVDPKLVFNAPGWDDELLATLGDRNVSIEGSVTIVGDTLYFANSGGLVQGWDIAGLGDRVDPERVFRFWTGDDTDATVVADEDGMLYVAVEWDRRTARARELGQFLKLDPSRPDDPVVWAIRDQTGAQAGAWATPALHRDVVYIATHRGELLAVGRDGGEIRWRKQLTSPMWSSPVVVDDILVQGDCSGTLRAYDVRDTAAEPAELWALQIGGCIESTPAVWRGGIYVGTRAGLFVAMR